MFFFEKSPIQGIKNEKKTIKKQKLNKTAKTKIVFFGFSHIRGFILSQ